MQNIQPNRWRILRFCRIQKMKANYLAAVKDGDQIISRTPRQRDLVRNRLLPRGNMKALDVLRCNAPH